MSRRTLTRAPDPHRPPPVPIATRQDLFDSMGALLLPPGINGGPDTQRTLFLHSRSPSRVGGLLVQRLYAERLMRQISPICDTPPTS